MICFHYLTCAEQYIEAMICKWNFNLGTKHEAVALEVATVVSDIVFEVCVITIPDLLFCHPLIHC